MRISYCSSDVCSSDLTRRKGRSISVSEDIGSDANARQDGQWDDHYWWSADGVRLHARIYPGPAAAADAPPLLCMPGLARNARDFEALAPHVVRSPKTIVVEFPGRGDSANPKDTIPSFPPPHLP